ncbi:MAG: hypothetical protein WCA53_07695, partial [Caballeronia sp.]
SPIPTTVSHGDIHHSLVASIHGFPGLPCALKGRKSGHNTANGPAKITTCKAKRPADPNSSC